MSFNFLIRQANDGNFEIIKSLLTQEFYDAGYTKEEIKSLEGTLHSPNIVAQTLVEASKDMASPTRCWLAFVGDEAVGIITTKDLSGGIFVHDEYRGQGIATELLQARNKFYKSLGNNFVEALIEASNSKSIGLHKKLGYKFNSESQKLIEKAVTDGIPIHEMKTEKGRSPVLVMTKDI